MSRKICKDRRGSDKMLHAFCEFVIASFAGVAISFVPFFPAYVSALIAFSVAIAIGIGKEVRDSMRRGNHFCVWDLAWDLAGSVVGALLAFVVNYYTWHDIAGRPI